MSCSVHRACYNQKLIACDTVKERSRRGVGGVGWEGGGGGVWEEGGKALESCAVLVVKHATAFVYLKKRH